MESVPFWVVCRPPASKEAVADEYSGDQDQFLASLGHSLSASQWRAREEEIPSDELCNHGEVCLLLFAAGVAQTLSPCRKEIKSKREKRKKLSWSLPLPRLTRCSTDGSREVWVHPTWSRAAREG